MKKIFLFLIMFCSHHVFANEIKISKCDAVDSDFVDYTSFVIDPSNKLIKRTTYFEEGKTYEGQTKAYDEIPLAEIKNEIIYSEIYKSPRGDDRKIILDITKDTYAGGGFDESGNYQEYYNQKCASEKTNALLAKEINKSLGGYKDFYFDMSINQINEVVKNTCPESEFTDKTSWGEALGYWNAELCVDFRGKKTSLNFYFNDNSTVEKIILRNIDYSLDSIDFATYYSKEKSGFVIYDELVGVFSGSSKYELKRFPTVEEVDLFNSFDDLKILSGNAVINTIFKNNKTGNLVYLTLKRTKFNNYGYDFDIIYFSSESSNSMTEDENNKKVSEDDI